LAASARAHHGRGVALLHNLLSHQEISRNGDLDFVALDLDFAAPDLDFVAA
jgi:hypothetical protein